MERKKIIVVTPEETKYLARLFNVSSVTVWAALKYRKSNLIHKKIRKAAIERGGQQMVLAPEFDTIYITNRADADKGMSRYMVQTFENGATLEGNLAKCYKQVWRHYVFPVYPMCYHTFLSYLRRGLEDYRQPPKDEQPSLFDGITD